VNVNSLIARKYFFSRKSGGAFNLITLISGISLLGYIVGTAALVVVLSVFNGFESLFLSLYSHFDPDIQVTALQTKTFNQSRINMSLIRQIEGVESVSGTLEENVLLVYDGRQSLAKAKGVDESYIHTTQIDSACVAGQILLNNQSQGYAAVGQGVAYQLSIDPEDAFKALKIYAPNNQSETSIDPSEAFKSSSIFPSGVFAIQEEVDNKYVLVPIAFLQSLLDKQHEWSTMDIRLSKGSDEERVKTQLQQVLGNGFAVKTRLEQREAYFKIMKSEKFVSYLILLFILLVASSNALGSLYILVMEKRKDIFILGSIGMSAGEVGVIFVKESLLIAGVGSFCGMLGGVTLCYLQQQYGFIKLEGASSVVFSAYPIKLQITDLMLVAATVMTLGFITSLYPARKAKELVR
jgi:ABC-type lipoprotein release transport system permease subunit